MPFSQLIARTAADIHPPLYYVLLKAWMSAAGVGPIQARLFSILVGTLTVPVVYVFARQLLPKGAAFAGFVVTAAAAFHVYYSQEVRMYGLLTLFCLAASYALLRMTVESRSESRFGTTWAWTGYVVFATAALYTEYYAALIVAAHVLYVGSVVALRRGAHAPDQAGRTASILRRCLAAWVVIAVLYAPWVLYVWARLGSYVAGKVGIEAYAPLVPHTFLVRHLVAWSVGHPTPAYSWLAWAAIVPLIIAALGALRLATDSDLAGRVRTSFLFLYLFVPLALAYLVNLRLPFHPTGFERLLLPAAPAYWLLIGAGLTAAYGLSSRLGQLTVGSLAAVAVLTLAIFYTAPRYADDDYRPIMDRLRALGRPNDVVLTVHPWQQGYLLAYLPAEHPEIFPVPARDWAAIPEKRTRTLDGLLASHDRLWFPAYQVLGRVLEDEIAADLALRAFPALDDWFGTTRLLLVAGKPRPNVLPVDYNVADQVRLTGIGLSAEPVPSAYGTVTLALRWTASAPLRDELRIAIRLTDNADYAWAVRDTDLLDGTQSFSALLGGEVVEDHQALLIPAGTPPGTYTLHLGLYRKDDGRRLELRDPAGQPLGVELAASSVEVIAPERAPPPEALPIQHPSLAELEDGVNFLGYSLPGDSYTPGEPLPLVLFWQAQAAPAGDLRVFVQAVDERGQVWGARDVPPVGGAFPASRWGDGTLVRDPHPLVLDPDTPDGTYRLIAGLYRPKDGSRLHVLRGPGRGKDHLILQDIVVRGRPHRFTPPDNVGNPLDVPFGDWAQLLGYSCDDGAGDCPVRPGERQELTLTWRALGHTVSPYKVFVHLEDETGHIWGQSDQVPGAGAFPTTGWVAGEYLRDRHDLVVREDLPTGTYRLTVGLYDGQTGQRIPVIAPDGRTAGDHIVVQTVTMRSESNPR